MCYFIFVVPLYANTFAWTSFIYGSYIHPTKEVDIFSNNGGGLDVKQLFGTNQELASLPALKTGAAFSLAKEFSIHKIESSALGQGKSNCGTSIP